MHNWTRRGVILSAGAGALTACTGTASREASRIDGRVNEAFVEMQDTVPFSNELLAKSAGVLMMPFVAKAGLVYGGSYGEGSLLIGSAPVDYYAMTAASFGLQIGVQKVSSALFFMNSDRLRKFRARNGWTVGADLEYTLLEDGETAELDSNTYKDDVYGLVFGQKGLHVGATLEGSKYSRVVRN